MGRNTLTVKNEVNISIDNIFEKHPKPWKRECRNAEYGTYGGFSDKYGRAIDPNDVIQVTFEKTFGEDTFQESPDGSSIKG